MPMDDKMKKEFQRVAGSAAIEGGIQLGFGLLKMLINDNAKNSEKDEKNKEQLKKLTKHGKAAEKLFEKQQYMEAIDACKDILKLDPEFSWAYYMAGKSYYELELYKEALTAFNKAIRYDHEYGDAYRGKGNVCFQMEKWQDAVIAYDNAADAYENAISTDPDNKSYYKQSKALCLIHQSTIYRYFLDNPTHSVVLAQKALTTSKKNDIASLAYESLAESYIALKMYQEALPVLQKALQCYPHDADLYCNQAEAYYRLEHYDEALTAIEHALALSNEPLTMRGYSIHFLRATLLDKSERYDEAFAAYNEAITEDPESTSCYREGQSLSLINKAFSNENPSEAISLIKKALAIDTTYEALTYSIQVENYSKLGKYAEALSAINNAIQREPNEADLYLDQAIIYYELERYGEAIGATQTILSIIPDSESAYALQGFCFIALNEYSEALQSFENALSINPNDVDYQEYIEACINAINGDPDAFAQFED